MPTRREFLKQAVLASAAVGMAEAFSGIVRRAGAIEPATDSTFLDAEHVVILMQENRSFDHCFGTLRGVRGFNDPRALTLADGNPVWAQANAKGERYVPFRLDIAETNATWMGCLPHSRTSQVDAWNQGKHDRWLAAKRSGARAYADLPLTLGHYTRDDIPFYYALADAFTVCDQHFCSVMSSTTPNRLCLWTGTIRAEQRPDSPAHLRNEDVDYGNWANWQTFPERLEEHGVAWKIYQNEVSMDSGLTDEEAAWLANFGDNPMEYFSQFNVQFLPSHRKYVARRVAELPAEIVSTQKKLAAATDAHKPRLQKKLDLLTKSLDELKVEVAQWTQEGFAALSPREKSLHLRAFCTNSDDADYRTLEEISYDDAGVARQVRIPKSDVLSGFRKDVADGTLPAVSWLVAPERFSDHPDSAWFGAWYIAEAIAILTQNPAVWRKTIFILNYDENDGYFDHVPPFVAPRPGHPETGAVSKGIDPAMEYVELSEDLKRHGASSARAAPIGLGYRVPMIIASPWSRGGNVCSQVFDHTSVIQFLETWLTHKTGKKIEEPNISRWRRAICGDLTSSFGAANDRAASLPFESREAFIEQIDRAQYKKVPDGFEPLTEAQLAQLRESPRRNTLLPRQEPGVRRSCPLPYELEATGSLDASRRRFVLHLKAGSERFGPQSAGAPFIAYAYTAPGKMQVRNYALTAGDQLSDWWALDDFTGGAYHLRIDGPNGFFREFIGAADDPPLQVTLDYPSARADAHEHSAGLEIQLVAGTSRGNSNIEIEDRAYGSGKQKVAVSPGTPVVVPVAIQGSFGWYDFSVQIAEAPRLKRRYAGRVETGRWSFSDPQMAGADADARAQKQSDPSR